MNPPRILLVDDHAAFRAGMSMLFRASLKNAEVLEAASLDEAMHGGVDSPDVVVLDILLRGLNGLEGIALLKRKWPQTPIVMLSSDAAPETVAAALGRGATAFVAKEKSADELLAAIVQAMDRGSPPGMQPPAQQADANASPPSLTPRQSEVLDLLCQGLSNKAIGRKLDLSENTVRWHVQAVLGFLNATSRSEAAFAARRRGLIC